METSKITLYIKHPGYNRAQDHHAVSANMLVRE